MKKFEILGHTADLRLKVEGTTLEELFSAAIEGMATVIFQKITEKGSSVTEEIQLESIDITSLLIDLMAETLTRSHINQVVYFQIEFEELTNTKLKAKIMGAPVDHFDEDVKAVTYHEANIEKNDDDIFETKIVFDI